MVVTLDDEAGDLIERNVFVWATCNSSRMWPYHPELLAMRVPRYTSFPTAAEFGPLDPAHYRKALEDAGGDISLYVHIPFCERICHYCGCNTGVANRRQRLQSYLDALEREIELVAALLPRDTCVKRVSFGGGSPNAIAPVDFARLVDSLFVAFSLADPVISIELDPRSLTKPWGQVLATVGIERASLGVQTFAPHCQQAIGRVQSEDSVVAAVDLLRDAGVTSLNFDLMYGLPNQSLPDLEDSLQRTRVLGADRVALFGYAHVPHLVPRQRAIDANALPGQHERFLMAERGFAYFVTHGYTPVGFDHFAKPGGDPLASAALAGRLRRNFQGFTDDASPVLIGLGSSAISAFPDRLIQNEKNAGRYRMIASQGQLAANRGILRSAEDRERGAIIERLLCEGHAQIGSLLAAQTACALQPFVARGLASLDDNRLTITAEGLPYSRTIAALLDPYRAIESHAFSSAI